MIRRATRRLHNMRISKPSLMKEAAAIPLGHNTAIDSSPQCFSIGIGHDISRSRLSGSFLEGEKVILTPANDHGAASMNALGFTTLENENGSVDENNNGCYTETPGPISDCDRRTLSVHSDTTGRYDPESQIKNGRDQEKYLSTSTETGVTTTAAFLRRTAFPLHTFVVKYRCATETYGCAEVRVGKGNYIPRWRKGSELTYTVDVESFPTLAEAMQVKEAMQEAISMWKGIGASFKYLEVDINGSATFVVTYRRDGPRDLYARSFFPDDSTGELPVYNLALSNAAHLANILAHEVGHILGLRHEFADEYHPEGRIFPCVLLGKKNPRSIMNYYKDPGQLKVSEQDLRGLKELYECNDGSYKGLPIHDYDPISRQRVSREEIPCSHAMRKSGRKFSCRSALRNLGSFIFAASRDAKRATV